MRRDWSISLDHMIWQNYNLAIKILFSLLPELLLISHIKMLIIDELHGQIYGKLMDCRSLVGATFPNEVPK